MGAVRARGSAPPAGGGHVLLLTIDIEIDEVISEEVIFGSTGTNDDHCEATLEHWGV